MNSREYSPHAVCVMKSISLWWSQLKEVKNWKCDFNYFLMYLFFFSQAGTVSSSFYEGFPGMSLASGPWHECIGIFQGRESDTNLRKEGWKPLVHVSHWCTTNKPKTETRQLFCFAHDEWVGTADWVQLGDSSVLYGVDQSYLMVLSWQLVWPRGSRWLSSLWYFGADG